ncbi:hypothetical protein [Marinoscillum sp. MHG1-6]|uniref:hypothetical protein n=1 Tax=Marinoscillum sp. MHG1-6 TaxID=2959627 RepID=UPI0021574C39|nr:hypothetical protein [Marinoscillum sp. MHG1-6]
MESITIDSMIITRVKSLSKNQKNEVLDYLESLPKYTHSTRNYRRKGLKQIREALKDI